MPRFKNGARDVTRELTQMHGLMVSPCAQHGIGDEQRASLRIEPLAGCREHLFGIVSRFSDRIDVPTGARRR